MKKISLVISVLLIGLMFSSCTKNDSEISGTITKIDALGEESNADGATVYLMTSDTEYAQTTTTDTDGSYMFYPIDDGTYFIEAEYSGTILNYSGEGEWIDVKKNDVFTQDLALQIVLK